MIEINYNDLPVLLKPKELENILRLNITSVYKIIKRNDFPKLKISKRYVRIPNMALIKWVKENEELLIELRKSTKK